jgi:Phage related hypothetical protein (DUF1799)
VCHVTGAGCAKEREVVQEELLTPDAQDAWRLFQLAQTQWRVGMAGATGLDYAGIAALARWEEVDMSGRAGELVRILEVERIGIWAKEAATAEEKRKRGG